MLEGHVSYGLTAVGTKDLQLKSGPGVAWTSSVKKTCHFRVAILVVLSSLTSPGEGTEELSNPKDIHFNVPTFVAVIQGDKHCGCFQM